MSIEIHASHDPQPPASGATFTRCGHCGKILASEVAAEGGDQTSPAGRRPCDGHREAAATVAEVVEQQNAGAAEIRAALGADRVEIETAGQLARLAAALPPETPIRPAGVTEVDPAYDTIDPKLRALTLVARPEALVDFATKPLREPSGEVREYARLIPAVELAAVVVARDSAVPEKTVPWSPYDRALDALDMDDLVDAVPHIAAALVKLRERLAATAPEDQDPAVADQTAAGLKSIAAAARDLARVADSIIVIREDEEAGELPRETSTAGADSRTRLAALAGVDADSEHARLAEDILSRCRWARAQHDGHPNGAWSLREQLAAAVVLDDRQHLADMDYTREQAIRAVADGMYFPPADMAGWLTGLRAQL